MKVTKEISLGDILQIVLAPIVGLIIAFIIKTYSTNMNDLLINIKTNWFVYFQSACVAWLVAALLNASLRIKLLKIQTHVFNIEAYNTRLIENNAINSRYNMITTRILRDAVLPAFLQDEQSKDNFAKWLLENNFNKNQLAQYGFSDEIIDLLLKNYHETELEKLNQKKLNESNSTIG